VTLAEAIEQNNLLEVARGYVRAGLSVIPVRADGSKAAAVKWGELQERFPTPDELAHWFAPQKAVGVAVVCGKVSGNLAVLDFESDSAWHRWHEQAALLEMLPFFAGFPLVRTPKGGRHLYCRIREQAVAGGKLAMRSKSETLIEVRGEGHYVLAPGSPIACHPQNKPYTFETMGWLANG
jgi:hypothetical protein